MANNRDRHPQQAKIWAARWAKRYPVYTTGLDISARGNLAGRLVYPRDHLNFDRHHPHQKPSYPPLLRLPKNPSSRYDWYLTHTELRGCAPIAWPGSHPACHAHLFYTAAYSYPCPADT